MLYGNEVRFRFVAARATSNTN